MSKPTPGDARRALAGRLQNAGHLHDPALIEAVEAEPRENYLQPGIFLPTPDSRWRPLTPHNVCAGEWIELAYSDQSLVTQLDGHRTADTTNEDVDGIPTSSSTMPSTVVCMIEALDLDDGMSVLEIGTGTGYSSALLCRRLDEDLVTTIEVDPAVATRADDALEHAGHSTWTITGDGLLGHPRRAPYDRIIATCTVRRIPYTWIRQTRPDGIVLATVGSWSYGTGLAKLTVKPDGTAEGRIIARSSFMPARTQATVPLSGDLSARAAYPDTDRTTKTSPDELADWMPAFLAQLAAPAAQLLRAVDTDGAETVYLFDTGHESFAALTADGDQWRVRQGGPIALWDAVEEAITAWHAANKPDISSVRLQVTDKAHRYWIGETPQLRWEHRVA